MRRMAISVSLPLLTGSERVGAPSNGVLTGAVAMSKGRCGEAFIYV